MNQGSWSGFRVLGSKGMQPYGRLLTLGCRGSCPCTAVWVRCAAGLVMLWFVPDGYCSQALVDILAGCETRLTVSCTAMTIMRHPSTCCSRNR